MAQLGWGLQNDVPLQVSGLGGSISTAAAARWWTLAVRASDGAVFAWGTNGTGELGDGTTTPNGTPRIVKGVGGSGTLTGMTAVAGGDAHSLALSSTGTVYAWGSNAYGQLGDGTTTQRTTPIQASGLTAVRSIAAGRNLSLAVKQDGTACTASWATSPMVASSRSRPRCRARRT